MSPHEILWRWLVSRSRWFTAPMDAIVKALRTRRRVRYGAPGRAIGSALDDRLARDAFDRLRARHTAEVDDRDAGAHHALDVEIGMHRDDDRDVRVPKRLVQWPGGEAEARELRHV